MPPSEKLSNVPLMSETRDQKSRLRRNLVLFTVPALLSAATVFFLWQSHPDPAYWIGLIDEGRAFLEDNPWMLIIVLATLPGIGVPSSPVLILFGIVLAPRFGMPATLALAIAAQSLCSTWTYALASGPRRGLLTKYMQKHRELPTISERNTLKLGLILRLTPGIPYALQNIALGVVGMRLRPYLMVSIPTTSMWTAGFVLTGGAIFEGRAGLAITGIAILIVLVLATRMFSRRNAQNAG